MKIGLISCTSLKKNYSCQAREMYSESPRFSLAYQYFSKTCDKVYVLSAKYGLLNEDQIIEPYNETLNNKGVHERKIWSKSVIESIKNKHSIDNDEFIIIAGRTYYEHIIPHLRNYQLPLKGAPLGKWIPALRTLLGNAEQPQKISDCEIIHRIFNQMPRLSWHDITSINFNNGIYVVFEKSEKYKEYDRIVRIGTHTSDNRLKKRLTNHFVNENKDGSIFRKNIGLALLSKAVDPYLSVWNLNTSRPEICTSHASSINQDYQKKIEKEVTRYLQQNMSFVCIPVDQASVRLRLEEGLIASLNQSPDFKSSSSWLGLYNPKKEIAESGLWNSQGLNGILLNKQEIDDIKRMVSPKSVDAVQSQTQVTSSSQTRFDECVQTPKQSKSISTEMIAEYINQKLNIASHRGETYIDITSGDIHRELNLSNLMPSVCGAMRRIKQPQDQVLHTTKSGNSSTIKFRYFLKGRSFKLFPKW